MESKAPYSNERATVWIAVTAAVSLTIVVLMATFL
jgi:hypothetical protein